MFSGAKRKPKHLDIVKKRESSTELVPAEVEGLGMTKRGTKML